MTFGIIAIGALFGVLFNLAVSPISLASPGYFASRTFGVERIPEAPLPAEYFRRCLVDRLGGARGLLGLGRLLTAASNYWPTVHRSLPASFGQEFDAIVPAPRSWRDAHHGVFMTGIVVAVASFVAAPPTPACFASRFWWPGLGL